MSGGLESAAEVATGAMWARAVEPRAGEGAGAQGGTPAMCLNCGTGLNDQFCHRCGQNAHVHRSLGAIGHDVLHGVFHFEGKIWRTLPMLLFRPGELTRRYVAGERARFVSPLAMFLFTVFLMFALFNLVGGDFSQGLADGLSKGEVTQGVERAAMNGVAGQMEQRAAALPTNSPERAELLRNATSLRRELQRQPAPAAKETSDGFQTGWARLDHGIEKFKKNPALIIYKVQGNAYKFSWALILLSTPLVALLFLWRRGYRLYDHAVFVTYSITFMSLLAILLEVSLTLNLPGIVPTLLLWWAPVHMLFQLRGAYRLRWFSAAWRMVVLAWMAVFALVAFVLGLVGLGLLG